MKRMLVLVAALALLVAACASSDDGEQQRFSAQSPPVPGQTDSAPSPEDEDSVPVDPGDGIGDGTRGEDLAVVSPALAAEIDQTLADLATRLGDDRAISVTVAHELTWPDGSLGCPQPGMMYTQALVDGYRVELTDGESLYQYHGATGDAPFLCESALVGE